MTDWMDDLHTADDISKARQVLMHWSGNGADIDATVRIAEQITDRAVSLGLETRP